MLKYINLREMTELKETAADWFHSKWGIPKEAYLECMDNYLSGKTELGWFLCLDKDRIVGGMGVIENDFHDRKDLSPNICAVYTEEAYRKQGVAGKLLTMTVDDLRSKGITPEFGAREVDRVIRNEIKPLFVDEILFGKLQNGGKLRLSADGNDFRITTAVTTNKT